MVSTGVGATAPLHLSYKPTHSNQKHLKQNHMKVETHHLINAFINGKIKTHYMRAKVEAKMERKSAISDYNNGYLTALQEIADYLRLGVEAKLKALECQSPE